MLPARLARLDVLLSRAGRPGGMYPAFSLAARVSALEPGDAINAALRRTPLAPAWDTWRDPECTAAERAFALAAAEPSLAHVHLLLADLAQRGDDAHSERSPELRAALRDRDRALSDAYDRLLARLQSDFDSESERCATRRGFGFSVDEAWPLLDTPAALECFARGSLAWRPDGGARVGEVLSVAELAEHRLVHGANSVHASVRPDEYAALECPEALTSLALEYHGVAAALGSLRRSPGLRVLSLATDELTDDAAQARALVTLPLDTLTLSVPSSTRVPVPSWLAALAGLRSLTIHYPRDGTDGGAVDVPAALGALTGLTALQLHGVRSLPVELGRLRAVRTLTVSGWYLRELPAALVELTELETLRVDPSLALPGLPEGFERLGALRELRLGHLATPSLPEVLLRMPWLRRVELISARLWPASQESALRRALPDAYVFVAFTGNAR